MRLHTEFLTDRVLPLTVVVLLVALVAYSNVPPNLWVIQGALAEAVMLAYAVLLFVSAVGPNREWMHKTGAVLAVATFGGRAGGFLERAIETDTLRSLLLTNAAERLVLALGLVLWHRARARELAPRVTTRRKADRQWFSEL